MTRKNMPLSARAEKLEMSSDEIPWWGLRALEVFKETGLEREVYKHLPFIKRKDIAELALMNIDFAYEWDDLRQALVDKLQAAAIKRAVDGVKEPVYYQGNKVGTIKKYSDPLLMFLMKAHSPELYGDKRTLNVNSKSVSVEIRSFDAYGNEIVPEEIPDKWSDTPEIEEAEILSFEEAQLLEHEESEERPRQKSEQFSPDIQALLDVASPEQRTALMARLKENEPEYQAPEAPKDSYQPPEPKRRVPKGSIRHGKPERPKRKRREATSVSDCPLV